MKARMPTDIHRFSMFGPIFEILSNNTCIYRKHIKDFIHIMILTTLIKYFNK